MKFEPFKIVIISLDEFVVSDELQICVVII